jgi:hypothetical protein
MQYTIMLRPPILHLIRVCVMHAQATRCVFLCQNDGNMPTFALGPKPVFNSGMPNQLLKHQCYTVQPKLACCKKLAATYQLFLVMQ